MSTDEVKPQDLKGELAEVLAAVTLVDCVSDYQQARRKAFTFLRTHGSRLKRALEDAEKWRSMTDYERADHEARASEQTP